MRPRRSWARPPAAPPRSGRSAFITSAKHLGLPLEEVAALLAVWDSGSCSQVRADLRPRLVDRIAAARGRIAELGAFIASLHGALEHLYALPDRAVPCDPVCGFPAPTPGVRFRALPVTLSPSRENAQSERWRTAPVACSLTGQALAGRTAQWRQVLAGAASEPIPDGARLTLPLDRAGDVAALAASEQQCCPFFDFRLHLDGTRLLLEVRAPIEGAALLAELFTAPTAAVSERNSASHRSTTAAGILRQTLPVETSVARCDTYGSIVS